MEDRLERKDIRLLLACLIVAALSLAIGIPYFYRAFPEATIDFRITRDQAQAQAGAFLSARGLDPAEYRHSAAFQYDDQTKTFLERELGLEGATALIGKPVRLWRWSNRWVRELQKEEFQVELTTTGELVGFTHLLEEDQEGLRLSEAEARRLAEEFLVQPPLQRDLAGLEFVEAQAIERKNRMDYLFTWKLKDFEVEEATYRLQVGIQGDQVGSLAEFLKIPEAWQRDYRELRSRNEVTGRVAGLFMALTLVAMIVVLVGNARRQEVRWKTALVFGLIALALIFLAQLNALPLTIHGEYRTTETFGSFLAERLLFSLLGAIASGVFVAFLIGGAEPVYRRAYGQQVSLSHQFLRRGLCTKRFLLGSAIGLTLTAFFFAYQTVFYLVAEKLGAWSPAQIPYSEMVNTYFPWITVLLIGFMPAVQEEFISRAFSIPFFERFLKSRWAAVVVAALIWGFAHAGYPQQPFYIRGLEVGIAGVIVGWVMIRWGLLPALVWHYTVDALYTALILLRSSNPYFAASAAVSAGLVLVPLLAAAILYWRRRAFADPTPLLNQVIAAPAVPQPEPIPEAQVLEAPPRDSPAARQPLADRRVLAIGVVLIILLAPLLLARIEEPLPFLDFALTRDQALQRARVHLENQGVDVHAYQVVAWHHQQLDGNTVKYLLERQGLAGVNRLYQQDLQASLWEVRFFQPQQKEEYQVWVQPGDGAVRALTHQLEEEAPGADLDEDAARALAEAHLRAYGLDPAGFEVKEASAEKLKARRDHRFVWETRQGDLRNVDEARFRCEVKVAGDRPVELWRYLKLPEAWERARQESTALRAVLKGTIIALFVAVFLHLLWVLIRHVRRSNIHWKPLLLTSGLGAGLLLVGMLNGLPAFYQGYNTSVTLAVFTITQLTGWAFGLVAAGLLVIAGLTLASALYPGSLHFLRPSSWHGQWRETLLATGLALLAFKVHERLGALLRDAFATHQLGLSVPFPTGVDTFLPGANALGGALMSGLLLPVAVGIAVYYARRVLKKPLYTALVVIGIGAVSAGASAVEPGEFWLALALALLQAGYYFAVIAFILRDHIPAYVLTGFLSSSIAEGFRLLQQSAPFYQMNGALVWLAAGLVVLGLWLFSRRNPPAV